ncbi:MAG: sugar MFS transporter [Halobacteriaceae archaeon]
MPDATRRWTLAIFFYMLLVGATLQARGALVPEFKAAFAVSESLLGLVTPAFTVGFMTAMVVVGLAVGRLPVRRMYVLGVAASAGALFLVSVAPIYGLLLAAMLVRGAATGTFRAVDRPVLSHLYPAGRGRVLSLQSMAWAVGATAGPLLVTGLLLVGDWRLVYLLLAVAWLPGLALLYRVGPPPGIENEQGLSLAALGDVLREPAVAGACLALVFLGGIEANFFTWLPYYAAQSLPRGQANLVLSAYLAAYVPGRYVASRLADGGRYVDLLLVDAALAFVAVFLTLTFARGAWLFVGVFGAGFLIAGAFPVLLAWAMEAVPEYSGPVNAVGMVAGQVGFLVFPAVVGGLAERADIVAAMHAVTAIAGAYLLATGLNWVLGRRRYA